MSPSCRALPLWAPAAALVCAFGCAPLASSFRPPAHVGTPGTVRADTLLRWSADDREGVGSVGPAALLYDERPRTAAAPIITPLSRRDALGGVIASTASSALLVSPAPSNAAQTAREAVRRSAANLPGYGQADVFYPPYFRGVWRATREVVTADDMPLASLAAASLPATIGYEVRFVPVDGDGPAERDAGGKVVADRGYNERAYREAIRSAAGAAVPPAVRDSRWDSSNPNVLTLVYADGSTEEIKVTKRAAEVGAEGDTVFSSEYRRVTTTVGQSGVPSIRGNRVLTKWRKAGEGVVEGIEIVYADAAMMGDPMGGGGGAVGGIPMGPPSSSTTPKVSAKSRIRLEKL